MHVNNVQTTHACSLLSIRWMMKRTLLKWNRNRLNNSWLNSTWIDEVVLCKVEVHELSATAARTGMLRALVMNSKLIAFRYYRIVSYRIYKCKSEAHSRVHSVALPVRRPDSRCRF